MKKSVKQKLWHETLEELGEERGFYRPLGDKHNALFVEGDGTLVVTFDNLDDARQDPADRMPWGSEFISSRGWSSLGLGAHGWTWYRDDAVLDFFDELDRTGFFNRFDKVVFYGTSMAGYAASVFSAASPGARVIAMNPQATLDRNITAGWEPRYFRSWGQDFSGRYSYGPAESAAAEKVYLFYDPMVAEDAMHAALFQNDNVEKIRCTHFGHGLTSSFLNMGILKDLVQMCIARTPSSAEIYALMRARRLNPKYQKTVLNHLKETNRPWMVHTYTQAVLARSGGKGRPHFRNAMEEAAANLRR
ncbi:phosphoadenosine phosphosulfate reductase [Palleronia caenipelagi]|uniref:Phosphoadenosine phosphosulfate reductase n=1 Tax=Palleronia caenipelagi TaxID=2489174 RepID=A0A547Q7Q9_9RHOB|nr:phosphoadenosine phosphosulfate reductase [Palleronia caenipelagi]TRD22427.1 phosphoadenosine phosphosulfate reductase [Palleronia caenipelagi]